MERQEVSAERDGPMRKLVAVVLALATLAALLIIAGGARAAGGTF